LTLKIAHYESRGLLGRQRRHPRNRSVRTASGTHCSATGAALRSSAARRP